MTAPSNESSFKQIIVTSASPVASEVSKGPPSRRALSTESGQSWLADDESDPLADLSPDIISNMGLRNSVPSIRSCLKQNAQDTSICFFFHHYGATSIDPEARNGFNQLWQPMYLQGSSRSSLRLATAAITVNITSMWCFQGCDMRLAWGLFSEAVTAAQEALYDPVESIKDEMLMTVLLFDLYDSLILHYAPIPLGYPSHKYGALAMVEHRGLTNLATSQSRALLRAVRHSFVSHSLSSRTPFPERLDYLFDHLSVNDTKASTLDLISVRLSRIQSRQWTLRLENCLSRSFEERRSCFEVIIAEALQVENLLLAWSASITDHSWFPEYIARDSVTSSIQNAGFYGSTCSVWTDLEVAGTWILFFIRYITALQMIRQSFADEPSLLENNPQNQTLLYRANKKIQKLADDICKIIPFYLGDSKIPKNPIYNTSTEFPFTFRINPSIGLPVLIPTENSDHQKRASASGGWILFPQLVNLWRFAEPEDDAIPILLREGQLNWIKGQVRRLQNIFMFCEPVWFKRGNAVYDLDEYELIEM
ncbi:MAG: hypothetical protein M1812_002952 [Candelaria pacifica]|nr:MAG: hypothetical protein M1812_002952 [Candelaria pacifica]